MGRTSSSLKELKSLREAVVAEEKAKTQVLLQNLPENVPAVARAAAAPPAPSIVEPPLEEEDPLVSEPVPLAPTPPPVRTPPLRPLVAAAPAPPPVAPLNRARPSKEAALIIPLTPKMQDRLQRHVENARWSQAELVMELIRVSLHQGYPAIQHGELVMARAGTYRALERNPLESTLKIVSGQGIFLVTASPEGQEFQHWLSYFTNQQSADPEKSASQVCLFTLQNYLESIEDFKLQGWTKFIQTEAYVVTPEG